MNKPKHNTCVCKYTEYNGGVCNIVTYNYDYIGYDYFISYGFWEPERNENIIAFFKIKLK